MEFPHQGGTGGRAPAFHDFWKSNSSEPRHDEFTAVYNPPTPLPGGLAMDGRGNEQCLGFSLSGEAVSVESFVAVAEKLTDLLGELETSMTGGHALEWHIADLRTGSAHLAMRPHTEAPRGVESAPPIIPAALDGLKAVEGTAERPPHFSDRALRDAKSLVNAAKRHEGSLSIFGGDGAVSRQVPISQRLAAHVDELLGAASVAFGSLEGRIEALTVHDSIAFSIYDSITNRRIRCDCSRKTLDVAMKHFGKRVSVSGEVRFNLGEATSMKVDEVHPLGTGPLPQTKDILGLFADHKIDTDEWSKFVREKW